MHQTMKKQKFRKSFNIKDLNKLVKDENSCVHLQKMEEHLVLHPYHLSDLNSSIKEILNERIGKFCTRLDGILCGYKNIKLLSEAGRISEDSCFIHVNIQADFFIFKPATEKLLHGVVNKKSEDHIGCLVHNTFNASLPKPKNTDNWIGDSLDLNSEIELQINFTNFDGKLPYIRGDIISVLKESTKKSTELELQPPKRSSAENEDPLVNPKKSKRVKKAFTKTKKTSYDATEEIMDATNQDDDLGQDPY